MSALLLHVSDLHMGAGEDPEVERALAALVERVGPELVVASGDLTHRGRPAEHDAAARFLRSLGAPVLAVPGNHDMPYTFPARFTRTFAEFERQWETSEPTHSSATLQVVGLNSARPFRHQGGALRDGQLRDAAARLRAAKPDACRVAVIHHHLLGAPWRAARKWPLAKRDRVLRELADAGAELILGGHIHQAAVGERREFEIVGDDAHAVVVSIAPGFGRPRPNRLGEARGLHVYEPGERTLAVRTFLWRDGAFGLAAERTFPRDEAFLTG